MQPGRYSQDQTDYERSALGVWIVYKKKILGTTCVESRRNWKPIHKTTERNSRADPTKTTPWSTKTKKRRTSNTTHNKHPTALQVPRCLPCPTLTLQTRSAPRHSCFRQCNLRLGKLVVGRQTAEHIIQSMRVPMPLLRPSVNRDRPHSLTSELLVVLCSSDAAIT